MEIQNKVRSEDPMKTQSESCSRSPLPLQEFPPFLPILGGAVFNISADEPSVAGETEEQKRKREARNANKATRRADDEAEARRQEAADEQRKLQAEQRRFHRNLTEDFDLVGDRRVDKSPSANITIALHQIKSAGVPINPQLEEAIDLLTAAKAQVGHMREGALSSIRSRWSRSARRNHEENLREGGGDNGHGDDRESHGNHPLVTANTINAGETMEATITTATMVATGTTTITTVPTEVTTPTRTMARWTTTTSDMSSTIATVLAWRRPA